MATTAAGASVANAPDSPPTAHGTPSTLTSDYLYRALYLRREMLVLTTQNSSNTVSKAPSNKSLAATAEAAAASSSAVNLQDILLLPPLYGIDGLTIQPSNNDTTSASDPLLTLDHAWKGLVHIRGPTSPWYRGCFAFYVCFPSRYPFEPPVIELAGPLPSHPLVQERCVLQLDHLVSAHDASSMSSRVAPPNSAMTNASTSASSAVGRRAFLPFEEAYAALDPMRDSVMAALLHHVLRSFYPAEWTPAMEAAGRGAAAKINRVLARRDVERRSVTQEVVLSRPFEQYVDTDVMEHFLHLWDTVASTTVGDVTGTVEGGGADWYTREVLPHLLHS